MIFISYITIIKYRPYCHAFETWIYWKSFLNLHEFVVFFLYKSSFKYVYVNEWVIFFRRIKGKIMLEIGPEKLCIIQPLLYITMGYIKASYFQKKCSGKIATNTFYTACTAYLGSLRVWIIIHVQFSYWKVIFYARRKKNQEEMKKEQKVEQKKTKQNSKLKLFLSHNIHESKFPLKLLHKNVRLSFFVFKLKWIHFKFVRSFIVCLNLLMWIIPNIHTMFGYKVFRFMCVSTFYPITKFCNFLRQLIGYILTNSRLLVDKLQREWKKEKVYLRVIFSIYAMVCDKHMKIYFDVFSFVCFVRQEILQQA